MSRIVSCLVAAAVALGVCAPVAAVRDAAGVDHLARPVRSAPGSVTFDPATRRIVVVGDSILFTRLQANQRPNMIVPLAQIGVANQRAGTSVTNRSYPGLSTLHTIDPHTTTLRPYLTRMLDAPGPPPDLVVVAVSSIDINLIPNVAVASLAPALIDELRAVERLLHAHGVDAVFLPAFGINGHMYNDLRSLFAPFHDYRFDERVNKYNELLRLSGLPLLFERFVDLDRNGEGNADRRYFVDNDPLAFWPDDGIHPNALGERVFGDNLANGLVAAFERGE